MVLRENSGSRKTVSALTKIQNRCDDVSVRYGKPTGVAITMMNVAKITKNPIITSIGRLHRQKLGTKIPPCNRPIAMQNIPIIISGLSVEPPRPWIGMKTLIAMMPKYDRYANGITCPIHMVSNQIRSELLNWLKKNNSSSQIAYRDESKCRSC